MADPDVATMAAVPAHVPRELVIDFDYFHPGAIVDGDVHAAIKRALHDGRSDIVWTQRHGGHWILSRADDVRWAREEATRLSRSEFIIPRGMMNTLMPPVNVDPPYHARFRAVFNPSFTPKAALAMQDRARAIASDLIVEVAPKGRCDFVTDFARVMPVVVFLELLGLPADSDRRAQFLDWAKAYLHAEEQGAKDAAFAEIAAYLSAILDEREARPGTDIFSRIAAWRRNPRYGGEDEVMGMAMTAFLGGLDTVTSMMAFVARHLADHPEARRRIVDRPGILGAATEEYLRRHAISMSGRLLTEDVTRKGVTMRKDDMLLVVDVTAGIDEREFSDPMNVDFDRDPAPHHTFGNGVHRCLGEHLARVEIAAFIEQWLAHIPDFRLDPDLPPVAHAGTAIGLSQLGLRWD